MSRTAVGVRAIVAVGVLVGVLAGGWGRTPDVRAAVASRGDPVLLVTGTANGVPVAYGIEIGVSVATASTQIQHVTYALSGPVGTSVRLEFATDDTLAAKESYTYTATRGDQLVVAVTTVTTTGGSVPAVVTESEINVAKGLGVAMSSDTESGYSNAPVTTTVGGGTLKQPNVNWGS
jgi:hypothetical protein